MNQLKIGPQRPAPAPTPPPRKPAAKAARKVPSKKPSPFSHIPPAKTVKKPAVPKERTRFDDRDVV